MASYHRRCISSVCIFRDIPRLLPLMQNNSKHHAVYLDDDDVESPSYENQKTDWIRKIHVHVYEVHSKRKKNNLSDSI